jgi:hypothetical protein
MASDNQTVIVGNLVDDPELRFTNNGIPVANLRVAVSQRVLEGGAWRDGPGDQPGRWVWRRSWKWSPPYSGHRCANSALTRARFHAGKVVIRQRPGRTAGAAWAGEDAVVGAASDHLPVGQKGLDRLLVEGDYALAGLGLGSLLHHSPQRIPVRAATRTSAR